MHLKRFFLFLLVASSACGKKVDFPPELRPRDFYVRYTLVEEATGAETPYTYRGEDTTASDIVPGLTFTLSYFSNYAIRDSIRQISAGIACPLLAAPFTLRLNHPEPVTDPFAVPEWKPQDLESVLYTGKTFVFGDAPGEAKILLTDYPNGAWTLATTPLSNKGGYLRILELEDYGSPEISVPYFGKKVRLEFAGTVYDADGKTWKLRAGEAELFFRYYKF